MVLARHGKYIRLFGSGLQAKRHLSALSLIFALAGSGSEYLASPSAWSGRQSLQGMASPHLQRGTSSFGSGGGAARNWAFHSMIAAVRVAA